MKFAPVLILALLLTAPSVAAAPADPAYPPEFVALLPAWIAEAEARVLPGDDEKAWWPEAEGFLERARTAADEGRFRVAEFHLETFTELVVGNHLVARAKSAGSAAEQRAAVTQQTNAWHADAEAAWLDFRARLHAYDGQLRSLQAIEKAIYAADMAIAAAASAAEHELYVREFAKQPGLPEPYVIALTRASFTPLLALGYAQDVLDAAIAQEGLPPRVNDEIWSDLAEASLNVSGEAPGYLKQLDELSTPARENGEGILAVAFWLAEQRATRLNGMQTMFGDAQTRNVDVTTDSAKGLRQALNNTSIRDAHDRSLSGVFTADAVDRTAQTLEYLAEGRISFTELLVAWSAIEHAGYVFQTLGIASPTAPQPSPISASDPDRPIGQWWDGYRHREGLSHVDYYQGAVVEDEKKTPAPALLALLGVAIVAAAFVRRR